ncbi:MAG: hypothetical protein R2729_26040 [Bryobacteraceae bacterium]
MATFAAQPKPDFAIWEVPGRSRRIVYSTGLMRELAALAANAAEKEPGDGAETGGILFGTADDYEVRVVAHRPIRCDHTAGREFLLSTDDERALRVQLSAVGNDPLLGGLVVVGWYHSHTRSPICLTAEDMRIWEIYFPMPWQMALVLRPQKGEPTRGGFFFRPSSGPVRTDSSYKVFEADADTTPAAAREPAPQPTPPPAPVTPIRTSSDEDHEEFPLPPPELLWQEPERSRRPLILVIGILAALGASGYFLFRDGLPAPVGQLLAKLRGSSAAATEAEPDIGLRLVEKDGNLVARWNRTSPLIKPTTQATLDMGNSGGVSEFPLSAENLVQGEMPVLRSGLDSRVRLRIETLDSAGQPLRVESWAYFLGRAPKPAAAAPAVDLKPLQDEIVTLESTLARQIADNDTLAREVAALDAEEPQALAEPAQADPPTPQTVAAAQAAAPQAAAPKPEPPTASLPAAPAVIPEPQAQAPVEAPRPVTPQPPPAPVYSGPRSGRVIWTGFLAPGSSVTINGRTASTGNVNAALPGVPVRLSVYPAEFTSAGISVFSANQRHASGDVTEGRSARNGWMNLKYVYDTERARDAAVGAGPAEGDGYKRITIRGGSRPVAAVVIEWAVADQ